MKKFSVLLFAALATSVFAATISVDDLVKKASANDKKVVTVKGTVKNFKQKTSKAGNKYYVFDLKGSKESANVYGRGEMKKALKDGDKVEITGEFLKEKKLKDFSVKNQVEIKDPEKDVKIVK